ncbi:MAG: CHAP domain-containing protein [Ruminococcus sp.]|nr:CHAP domain-containing protein [Ruminococcus sp.]
MKTKRLFSFVMALIMMFSVCLISPVKVSVPLVASATQTRKSNFNKNYSLTGNGPTDMLNIAFAQVGKTGEDFGYTESWCANFVSDCADLAGQSQAIPRTGAVSHEYTQKEPWYGIKQTILNAGGYIVGSPQPGDIVIWKNSISHVEIVSKVVNGVVYSIGGNNGGTGNPTTNYVAGQRRTASIGSVTCYIRPNYSGNSTPEPAPSLVTPSISTDKSSYTAGDIVNISWTPSPDGSNLEHYWLKIDDPNGNTIVNETMNRNTSYSFTANQSGNYTITAFATPYNSPNGEGSLTDTKTIYVKPKDVYYDLSLSERYIELEPGSSKDITLTVSGELVNGGIINSDTTNCADIVDIGNGKDGIKSSSYAKVTFPITALKTGSGSCKFYVDLDGKIIGSVVLSIKVTYGKCKVKLVDNFRLNTIDEYEIECGSTFSSSQLPTLYKEGYSFDGWYDGNTEYSAGSTVPQKSELRLYAQWKANNSYEIYFDRYGDINGDGKVSAIDASYITMYINGTKKLTEIEKIYADLDGDDDIDERDVKLLALLYTTAPGNESSELYLARLCWEDRYLYSYPLLSLKINGHPSYKAQPGEKVKLTVEVSGADMKYSSVGLHFSYDDELTLSRLKAGEAVESLSPFYNDYLSNCFLIATGLGNNGHDGVIMETDFTIPEDAETGKVYPFIFYQGENDLFTNKLNDKYGKKMQESAFRNWHNCSVTVIGGKGDINTDGLITVADAVTLKRWLLSESSGTYIQNPKTADLNGDNRVDVFDLVAMKQLLVK